MRTFSATLAVFLSLLIGCDGRTGVRVIVFDDFAFAEDTPDSYNTFSTTGEQLTDNCRRTVEITIPGRTAIRLSDLNRDWATKNISNSPDLYADDLRYATRDCAAFESEYVTVFFKNDELKKVHAKEGCKIRQGLSNKSITLPVSESLIRETFGAPKNVRYAYSRQP